MGIKTKKSVKELESSSTPTTIFESTSHGGINPARTKEFMKFAPGVPSKPNVQKLKPKY